MNTAIALSNAVVNDEANKDGSNEGTFKSDEDSSSSSSSDDSADDDDGP